MNIESLFYFLESSLIMNPVCGKRPFPMDLESKLSLIDMGELFVTIHQLAQDFKNNDENIKNIMDEESLSMPQKAQLQRDLSIAKANFLYLESLTRYYYNKIEDYEKSKK